MESCPVPQIHKLTEQSGESVPSSAPSTGGVCPITGMKSAPPAVTPSTDLDFAEFEENPSYQEYKKIKRVMAMITRFYITGSEAKKANYDTVTEEIKKLDTDMAMLADQLAALESNPNYSVHPKKKEYQKDLLAEKTNTMKQRETLVAQQKEFYDLFEWSKGIVKVCQWLEGNLDNYCAEKLKDLPEKVKARIQPPKEITKEEAVEFAKGLDEVVYNLRESQDFFAASLDGRLNRYHNIEKEIIEAQLAAIRKYPEDNPRRMYIEEELMKDLEYVGSNMEENPETTNRREKMLNSHNEFYLVLMYNKEKLESMGITVNVRVYDTKYDHYN